MGLPVPPITLALALTLLAVTPVSFVAARRGGRFRGLPGWVGFWGFFAPLLVLLSRAHRSISVPLLGALMFAALREYFFLAPLRPRDRWAILLTYVSIPLALYPAFQSSGNWFLVVVPVVLLVFLPVLLAVGSPQAGLLESAGRLLVGGIAFVFCAAYLGLMVRGFRHGEIELFGVLVLAAEVPQRLAGRVKSGEVLARPLFGVLAGAGLAAALGAFLGPLGGISSRQGAVAGLLLAAGTAAGALLADAVAQDLNLGASTSRVGRGAFLDRTFPVVYAAPAFFHYVTYSMASQ